jgi:16S rRNA (cytosine967-C5)-methyltransferase
MSTRSGTQTRALAIDALTHILTRRMHADMALDRLFAHHQDLKPLDRAFVFEIVYGSLRWLSKMDWILAHMVDRPLTSLDPRVHNALRVGTYQIFYMDRVPDRASVSETVEAVKLVGAGNATKFVNALLRRVARKAEYFPKPDKETKLAEYLAMHYAHPQWLVERWLRNIPLDRLEHMLDGNNTPPKMFLKVVSRNPIPSGEDLSTYLLREFGIESRWRPLKGTLQVDKLPPLDRCEAFKAGCYFVQDEAAQLSASLVQPSSTDSILDACSAPGGKSMFLWADGLAASQLTLADFSQKRIKVLEQNLSRLGLDGCEIKHGCATEVAKGKTFQKVILDAPCTALGVIRRHPEIKWLRSLADVENCAKEQRRLMAGLAPLVELGGELIYIVCSQEIEETTMATDAFLAEHGHEFQIVPLDGRIHDYYRKYATRRGELLVLPGNSDELDGFYAVVLRRSKPL